MSPMDPTHYDFLSHISWREAWLSLEAVSGGDVGAYPGSAVRGALGHLLRPLLCTGESGAGESCGHECGHPDSCEYFALFEQSRAASGGNAPKPLILTSPMNEDLDAIALGGPVNLPFRTGPPAPGEAIPTLRNEYTLRLEPGALLQAGVRVVGALSVAVAGVVEAIARHGLHVGGALLRLNSATDGTGRVIYDRRFPAIPVQSPALNRLSCEAEAARRIRIVFQTPSILKLGTGGVFDPPELAARFIGHSMARAVQVHNSLTGRPRLPWLEAPRLGERLAGHRLFHYEISRRSYRQDKWLQFDGVVGYIDLAGELDAAMPFARAAEILHFGQKAAFGLGRIRVLVLE